MIDTLRLTAEEAMGLLERREVSSAELFDAYRDAIAARDGELNCFLTTVDEPTHDGVPIALKDVIGTKGVRTTAGSRFLERYVPVYDSTVATRVKDAGLPPLGKTKTDEFAMGSSTENSAYGPTRNPWDPSRVPGGSGGGSAAAVAAGLAPWALGSDTGGSVKLPSAFCGNVGLRPTYGTVSRYGIVAFASSLDQVGPATKTIRDCAFLYSVISGRDENDSTTVDVPEVELPEGFDVLVSPTCATTAFAVGAKTQDPLAMYLTDVLTIPSNMAGLPSLSIPCGLSDGLPVGLQLIGPQFAENTLFKVAHALEGAIAFDVVPERLR